MKLTIDICDCDKACLIRDWLPCPHLTNERPPLALSDQSAASVTLSVSAFSWFPRLLVTTGCSPHPLPVQSPLSGSHVNRENRSRDTELRAIREIHRGHGDHLHLVTLVTTHMRGASCDQAWSVVNFKSFVTQWRHAGGSRHLGQVSRPASGNWQQICGGETAKEGKLAPRAGSRRSYIGH